MQQEGNLMFKLSEVQGEWIEQERDIIKRIIEAKPKEGIFSYHMQYEILNMLVSVHNVGVKEERNAKPNA